MIYKTPAVERFWEKVKKTDSCWLWLAGTSSSGYGNFRDDNSKQIGSHVYSYILHNGFIPIGKWVLHTCDNRACVKPDHLYAGTKQDNGRDMARRNRAIFGEMQINSKLTEFEVSEIRSKKQLGYSNRKLAIEYSVSHILIGKIINKELWTKV